MLLPDFKVEPMLSSDFISNQQVQVRMSTSLHQNLFYVILSNHLEEVKLGIAELSYLCPGAGKLGINLVETDHTAYSGQFCSFCCLLWVG